MTHLVPSYLTIHQQVRDENPKEIPDLVQAIATIAWCAHEDWADGVWIPPPQCWPYRTETELANLYLQRTKK